MASARHSREAGKRKSPVSSSDSAAMRSRQPFKRPPGGPSRHSASRFVTADEHRYRREKEILATSASVHSVTLNPAGVSDVVTS